MAEPAPSGGGVRATSAVRPAVRRPGRPAAGSALASGARSVLRDLPPALARAAAGVRWYWTTLMGDHDYARYVAHLARVHPGEEPESIREYWRSRHDSPVQTRCC